MKKIYFLTLLFLAINGLIFSQSSSERKTKIVNDLTTNLVSMYEGEVIGNGGSFYATDQSIYTLIKVKVISFNYGNNVGSEILLAKKGGSIGDREEIIYDDNAITKHNTFFNYSTSKVKDAKTNQEYFLLTNVAYDDAFNIVSNSERLPFKTYNDFYSAIKSKLPVTYEKKSANVLKESETFQIPSLPYEITTKNYFDIVNARIALKNKGLQNKTSVIEGLDLQLLNPSISGSAIKFYEFDVYVKGSSSNTYLDNVPVHISYNSAAFGTNAVAAGKVFVTNGSNFNNSNYVIFNNNKTDFSTSVIAFMASADNITTPTPFRTNITTTFQKLAHVRIQLNPCGVTPNVSLTNAPIALNVSFYATFPNQNVNSTVNYDNLNYLGSPLSTFFSCAPTISDFNSPVRGGVDTLRIKGYNFGITKGDVYFKNADVAGFPYVKIDTNDYIKTWTDTLITIKMPSFNRALLASSNKNNTPGTGAFKVVTSSSQTVTSVANSASQNFTVSWSLLATDNASTGGRKRKLNLINSNSQGGYTLYCDTSVGKHPFRYNIVRRALHDWSCLTTSSIVLIYDSTITNSPSINFLRFTNFGALTPFAITTIAGGSCPTTLNKAILNFDIDVRSDENWFYDTTGLALPANMADFYEIISHELGHCLGLQHIIDVNSLLYFAGNYSSSLIPAINRRKVKQYSEEVNGGLFQVSNSIAVISPADAGCSFTDIAPYQGNCSNIIAVKEISNNQMNAKLFPNPSTDGYITITFTAEGSKESLIQVNDMLGNIVFNNQVSNSSNEVSETVNLSSLSAGIYILTLHSSSYKSTFKIIKQ